MGDQRRRNPKKARGRAASSDAAEVMAVVSLRLPRSLVDRYEAQATPTSTRSQLMRAALEGKVARLPVAPVVPEVNRELWTEMRIIAADLHQAVRMVEGSRSTDLDEALSTATISAAGLVRIAATIKKEVAKSDIPPPAAIKKVVSRALADAAALNSGVHEQMRPQLRSDREAIDRLHDTVHRLIAVCGRLSQQLLGS